MIKENIHNRKPKAVGLISGGLDSTLAAKIVLDLGVEVYGVYFAMPWGCCDKAQAQKAALNLGIHFVALQLDERYLEMVRKPKFGYGTALNPCVDCRIHMFSRAAEYMKAMEADFVFTGEVVGQRPMSQMKHSMKWIEEESGLNGRLLRPLCAKLLDPTIPEKEGLIDRNRLLEITGRSRKEQIDLAAQFQITDYSPPAGGCLLTDEHFARRMRDTFKFGYRNFRETVALKWGRHFRINENFKVILGRDKDENESLIHFAHPEDHIFQLPQNDGPTLILKGYLPKARGQSPAGDSPLLSLCAGLVQKFSKYKDSDTIDVLYWPASNKTDVRPVSSRKVTETELEAMRI